MSLMDKIRKNKQVKKIIEAGIGKIEYIDTGSYALNILFSGTPNGGIPKGYISQIAGVSGSGKSMVAFKVAKAHQDASEDNIVVWVDSERAMSDVVLKNSGLDKSRVLICQENRIEKAMQFVLGACEDLDDGEKSKVLIVIDSWNMLVSKKKSTDSLEGNNENSVDFTISKLKNDFSRLLAGLSPATVLVINIVTAALMQMGKDWDIPGGTSLYYSSSAIVLLTSKAKERDDENNVTGALIRARAEKGRMAIEQTKFQLLISHTGALDRYFGLFDYARLRGHITNKGNFYRRAIDGDSGKAFTKREILANPEAFWKLIYDEGSFIKQCVRDFSFEDRSFAGDAGLTSEAQVLSFSDSILDDLTKE